MMVQKNRERKKIEFNFSKQLVVLYFKKAKVLERTPSVAKERIESLVLE